MLRMSYAYALITHENKCDLSVCGCITHELRMDYVTLYLRDGVGYVMDEMYETGSGLCGLMVNPTSHSEQFHLR
jgi:hypothetical protein